MPDVQRQPSDHAPLGRPLDRRAMLAGTAGAVFGAMLGWPSLAAARPETFSLGRGRFDPVLARRLQQALDVPLRAPGNTITGAILHVETARGSWAGTSGLGRLHPQTAIETGDRFRAGSVIKPFISTRILQLAESGRVALESTLPELLPAAVVRRFPTAPDVTLGMLLGHRSGLPEFDSTSVDAAAARHPRRVWTVSEFLDLAAGRAAMFEPGARYAYCNTNYTLAGLVIEHATGRSWRDEVGERVVEPLGLEGTRLPAPGDGSFGGPFAHGYMQLGGELVETSHVDPSMAGSAGGNALVTTAGDLVRFFDALLAGKLFRRPETLKAMTSFRAASGEPGQVGYGLGLFERVFPGGVETIDHLGGTGGYMAYVARLPRQGVTMAVGLASATDPSPVLLPVLGALAAGRP
jgi:D-alanyl-D-alanine carboxypeptidase